jgi:hypothetical protein
MRETSTAAAAAATATVIRDPNIVNTRVLSRRRV